MPKYEYKRERVPKTEPCSYCRGEGASYNYNICSRCSGKGEVIIGYEYKNAKILAKPTENEKKRFEEKIGKFNDTITIFKKSVTELDESLDYIWSLIEEQDYDGAHSLWTHINDSLYTTKKLLDEVELNTSSYAHTLQSYYEKYSESTNTEDNYKLEYKKKYVESKNRLVNVEKKKMDYEESENIESYWE